MELLVKSKASTFRGDYYSHGKQFVAALPIYKIDFNDPDEVNKYQNIVDHVQTIMQLKQQMNNSSNTAERTILKRSMGAVTDELNALIDILYQVQTLENEE